MVQQVRTGEDREVVTHAAGPYGRHRQRRHERTDANRSHHYFPVAGTQKERQH